MIDAVNNSLARAIHRKPPELHGEHVDEKHRQREDRRSETDEAHGGDGAVQAGSPANPCCEAKGDGNDDSDDERVHRERHGDREALSEGLRDRQLGTDGSTEVEPQHALKPVPVLGEQWLIEVVERPNLSDRLRSCLGGASEQGYSRIPRRQREQAEDEERHHQQDGDHPHQSARHEGHDLHGGTSNSSLPRCRSSRKPFRL